MGVQEALAESVRKQQAMRDALQKAAAEDTENETGAGREQVSERGATS